MMDTRQRDPRELNEYTESDFRQIEQMAAYQRERARVAAMTPAQWANEQLETVAKKYGMEPYAKAPTP